MKFNRNALKERLEIVVNFSEIRKHKAQTLNLIRENR